MGMSSNEHKNSNSKNFTYLNDLIQNSTGKIILKSDVILTGDEEEIFAGGIEINRDIVVDGCNHVIDVCEKTRIFKVNSRNVTLKNIIFKNAFGLEDGGAIKLNPGKLKVSNCKFINCSCEKNGSAIHISPKSRLSVSDSEFLANHAGKDGCIYNFNGKVEINNTHFVKNTVSSIINQRRGKAIIENTHFLDNNSDDAGAILNYGKCDIVGCLFKSNVTLADGGAINNQVKSRLSITDTKFIENECRGDGGAIVNFSKAILTKVKFLDNVSNDLAGAISNQKESYLTISDSKFKGNRAQMNGGAIINWGNFDIDNCRLENNTSLELGGAIFNHESSVMKAKSARFISNSSNSGGAIFNWGRVQLMEVLFKDNRAETGGAVNTAKRASFHVHKSEFINNSSKSGGAIFNNCGDTKIVQCNFSEHHASDVIYNLRLFNSFNNVFEANTSENIIFNDDGAVIRFFGGEFNNNAVNDSVIHNAGDSCSLEKITFSNNSSKKEFCSDIYNKTYLRLTELKFKSNQKTVLNMGVVDFKRMDDDIVEKTIHNLNVVNDLSKKANKYDFESLESSINEMTNLKLIHNYSIGKNELDFYEGGIEIGQDNMVIDGDGHTIDGVNSSRIFIINARNVILRNIIFKNGMFSGNYDRYCHGGGAIFVLRNASVSIENCQFIENNSMSNGGAILNDGDMRSLNNKFINNGSETFGGAIENKNMLTTMDDDFKGNSSRIGGAIYNKGDLCIRRDILLSDNASQFRQDIYNAGFIRGIDVNLSSDWIFNTSKIGGYTKRVHSFSDLANEIDKSNEIRLSDDVRFDFKRDMYLKYRIDIKKDLTIDGCGHAIEYNPLETSELRSFDCMKSASLFRIRKENIKVILKNIVFKNCYSNGQDIIENHGELVIENCRFINNQVMSDNSLINNNNCLKIVGTSFSNNISNGQSLIENHSILEISDADFINNNSHAIGCCISNGMEALISDSIFKSNNSSNNAGCISNEFKSKLKLINDSFEYNDAEVDGGAIYNYGEIEIENSKFTNNSSKDEGGAINSRTSGKITVSDSEFIENESKSNGGAIFNYGKMDLSNCIFFKNNAKIRSGAIEHTRPLDNREITHLKMSGCEFKCNFSRNEKSLFSYEGADVDMTDCRFDDW